LTAQNPSSLKTTHRHFRDNFPALAYLGLAVLAILLGLGLRLLPVGLPYPLVRWGGSVLWAVMVYLLFAAFLPGRSAWTVFGIAGVAATLMELLRLYHSTGLDAFRLTLADALLLGRVFTPLHFVCYWGGVGIAALVDWWLIRRVEAS